MCVGVLHIKPFGLPGDTQHNLCHTESSTREINKLRGHKLQPTGTAISRSNESG